MRHKLKFLYSILAAGLALIFIGPGASSARGMMGHHDGMMDGSDMQQMTIDTLPPLDPAQLPDPDSEGALLLQRFCTQCHNLPGPGMHTAEEWPAVVNRMNQRMRMMGRHGMMMGRNEVPSHRQSAVILDYLQAYAQRPLRSSPSPSPENKAGQAFNEVCARCHALPDPAQHSAGEWPAVVQRMKTYMSKTDKAVPDEAELAAINGYLQRHSGVENTKP